MFLLKCVGNTILFLSFYKYKVPVPHGHITHYSCSILYLVSPHSLEKLYIHIYKSSEHLSRVQCEFEWVRIRLLPVISYIINFSCVKMISLYIFQIIWVLYVLSFFVVPLTIESHREKLLTDRYVTFDKDCTSGKVHKNKLKADRPHPRNYPHTRTDDRHTYQHLRLAMAPIALYCTRQSRAPNIDRCAPEKWPWPLTLTRDLDLDLWPWPRPLTLTFDLDPDLRPWPQSKVKGM